MNKDKFKTDLELIVIKGKVPAGKHIFSPLEDAAAYFCAFTNKKQKDYVDLVVFRLNLLSGKALKTSSFGNRIANMEFEINGKGLPRNSEQGKAVASFIKKFMTQNSSNSLDLKDLINFTAGRDIV